MLCLSLAVPTDVGHVAFDLVVGVCSWGSSEDLACHP